MLLFCYSLLGNGKYPVSHGYSARKIVEHYLPIYSFMCIFQVCRVLKAYYHSSKESTCAASVVSPESQIEEALGSCLLPSLQLIPANPAVDMEIWGVLSLLPYEVCDAI